MIKSILAVCAVASASAQTNSSNYDAKWSNQGKNIVQLAQSVADLSELVTALTAGQLTTALSAKGPFTVFAPTNEAFGKLPSKTLASLLDPKNIKQLQDVLTYHVISGAAVFSKDLKTFQMVKTLEGDELKIAKAGRVIVGTDGAEVTSADNAASNGVVHIINGVLIPPAGPAPGPSPTAPTPAPASGNHLWFRGFTCAQFGNKLCRCGEVDAAPRMPASLFEPENKAALQRYIDITEKFYSYSLSKTLSKLEVGRCKDTKVYTSGPFGIQGITWTSKALMGPICAEQCHCTFGASPLSPSTLPYCKDQPDDPSAGKFCSLCGPKYNKPITISLYNGVPNKNGADKDGCRSQEAASCILSAPWACDNGKCIQSFSGGYTKLGCEQNCH